MPDYSKGKIYKIINDVNDQIYIGSTTQTESRRWENHKSRSQDLSRTSKLYTAMRRYGVESFRVVLIEHYPCNSAEELERREFDHIKRTLANMLLNTDIVYKKKSEASRKALSKSWTTERKKTMSEAFSGSKSPVFKGGCVSDNPVRKRWVVKWSVDGKRLCKYFSYGVRSNTTIEEAKALADTFKASLRFD